MKNIFLILCLILGTAFGSLAQTNTFTTTTTTQSGVNEGNGIGYRLPNQPKPLFGNIGLGASDFSNEYQALKGNSSFPQLQTYFTNGGFGATGRFSFVAGGANIASGNQSATFGIGNINSGASALVWGQGNQNLAGGFSALFGVNNTNRSSSSLVYGERNVINSGNFSSILGGSDNSITTANYSFIGGSYLSKTYKSFSVILGSSSVEVNANGSSILSTGNSKTAGDQTTIIASERSNISDKIGFSAILASRASGITKATNSGGAINQAIIASDSSFIYGGTDNDLIGSKWNNAIIASEQSEIISGISYNTTTGKFTRGNASAQMVVGILNEEFPHVGVTDPNKRTFVVGGGAQDQDIYSYQDPNSVPKKEWPKSYWNRRDVFYVQHNGKVFAFGDMNASQYKLNDLNTAPASATATGTKGEIRVTATHIYVCIDTNKWVRTALTTW